jgi:RND superfamily putative drug exporter
MTVAAMFGAGKRLAEIDTATKLVSSIRVLSNTLQINLSSMMGDFE